MILSQVALKDSAQLENETKIKISELEYFNLKVSALKKAK